jgi:thioredoxin 1
MRVIGEAQSSGGERGAPVDVEAATLDAFLAQNRIAMIDVWAEWCGPCRMMEPIVEELAHELKGRAGVGKVNADMEYQLVGDFAVQGIPTFLFFKDGKYATRLVGARPKRDFLDVIKHLESGPGPEIA